jgi:hypothetical protein
MFMINKELNSNAGLKMEERRCHQVRSRFVRSTAFQPYQGGQTALIGTTPVHAVDGCRPRATAPREKKVSLISRMMIRKFRIPSRLSIAVNPVARALSPRGFICAGTSAKMRLIPGFPWRS